MERVGLEVGIGFDKLRHKLVEEPEEVVEHKDLAVAVGACPDANGRNGQLFRHSLGQLGRNRFKYDGEGAGCFEGLGVIQQDPRMI